MTSRYAPLYSAISSLEQNTREPDFIPSAFNFPFEKMYPSQKEILSNVQDNQSFCLTSHTGWGKTPVFLSLTRNTPSIVIEPRIFLQKQSADILQRFRTIRTLTVPMPLFILRRVCSMPHERTLRYNRLPQDLQRCPQCLLIKALFGFSGKFDQTHISQVPMQRMRLFERCEKGD